MLLAILETLGAVGILLSIWAKFRARPRRDTSDHTLDDTLSDTHGDTHDTAPLSGPLSGP